MNADSYFSWLCASVRAVRRLRTCAPASSLARSPVSFSYSLPAAAASITATTTTTTAVTAATTAAIPSTRALR